MGTDDRKGRESPCGPALDEWKSQCKYRSLALDRAWVSKMGGLVSILGGLKYLLEEGKQQGLEKPECYGLSPRCVCSPWASLPPGPPSGRTSLSYHQNQTEARRVMRRAGLHPQAPETDGPFSGPELRWGRLSNLVSLTLCVPYGILR